MNDRPKISVICPTRNRQHLLPQLISVFQAQTWPEKELLILDDSPAAAAVDDANVHYSHSALQMSIGAKRNALIERATGSLIIHFDDDDFYAAEYLAFMADHLSTHDFVKFDGWYLFSAKDGFFGYWDTRSTGDQHHALAPWPVEWNPEKRDALMQSPEALIWGFGFSFAYRKAVWEAVRYSDMNFGEDYDFSKRVLDAKNFSTLALQDEKGLCLHTLHAGNSSSCYPQYRFPMFMLHTRFEGLPMPSHPRICLSMIIKDESKVIERCLRSVMPHIDSWAIVDTGSTDGTQDLVRRIMAGVPGELVERTWVDFATNRNQALDLARQHGDYALIIDADDVLETDPGFSWRDLTAAAYMFEIRDVHGVRYSRVSCPRLDAGWTWRGVLHEALYAPQTVSTPMLPGIRILRVFNDGARSSVPQDVKFSRDADLLKRALLAEPGNSRYAFYLAQSLRDAGKLSEAIDAYAHCATLGGWAEEVYYSKLQVAALKERTGAPAGEIMLAYLDAYNYRPMRAEAICEFARYNRLQERYFVARDAARIAADMPMPADLLFMDSTVYDWRARDELAVAAYWTGDRALSARICRELLADPRLPEAQRERVKKNLEFSEAK